MVSNIRRKRKKKKIVDKNLVKCFFFTSKKHENCCSVVPIKGKNIYILRTLYAQYRWNSFHSGNKREREREKERGRGRDEEEKWSRRAKWDESEQSKGIIQEAATLFPWPAWIRRVSWGHGTVRAMTSYVTRAREWTTKRRHAAADKTKRRISVSFRREWNVTSSDGSGEEFQQELDSVKMRYWKIPQVTTNSYTYDDLFYWEKR